MVLMGKQSIDDDYNQTGQMAAGLLNWPQATFASNVKLTNSEHLQIDLGDDGCEVEREIDGGLQTVGMTYPCLITCDLRLNEPRFASIPQIMKAKKKPIEKVKLAKLDIGEFNRLEVVSTAEPEKRSGGEILADVDELINRLKNEAKIL